MTDFPVMVIAGGTGSIGREIAAQALRCSWRVIIHGRTAASVDAIATELRTRHPGCPLSGIVADISEQDGAETLVKSAAAVWNRIDAVVDCVAAGPDSGRITGAFSTTDPGVYSKFMELSAVYLQRLTAAALPWLTLSRGCLVAFVSDAGIYPAPHQALIGAARAATCGFIRNLALEVARDGVRTHCVSLSFVEASAVASHLEASGSSRLDKARKRAGLGLPSPADIAPLVLFLCSDGAKHMTGQVISINGGLNT